VRSQAASTGKRAVGVIRKPRHPFLILVVEHLRVFFYFGADDKLACNNFLISKRLLLFLWSIYSPSPLLGKNRSEGFLFSFGRGRQKGKGEPERDLSEAREMGIPIHRSIVFPANMRGNSNRSAGRPGGVGAGGRPRPANSMEQDSFDSFDDEADLLALSTQSLRLGVPYNGESQNE